MQPPPPPQTQSSQQQQQQLIIYLNKEKCNLIKNLNFIKQQIQDIEMRQKEAIRDVSILMCFILHAYGIVQQKL